MGFCGKDDFIVWHQGDFSKCFEDSVVMLIPAMFLLIFGFKRLYHLETKRPDISNLKQLFTDFQSWRQTIQLEVIVSILLVAWKILFLIVGISINRAPYVILYSVVTFLQWLFSAWLVYLELKKGQSRSWEVRLFWIIAFITATVKLRTLTLAIFGQTKIEVKFIEYISFVGGYCLILILSITGVLFFDHTSGYTNLDKLEEDPEHSVEENANLFSRLTFWWVNGVLRRGYKKSLEINEVPKLTKIDHSKELSDKFRVAWEHQLTLPNPSLPWALSKAFGPHFYMAAIFKVIQDSLIFVGPILLGKVIGFVTKKNVSTYDGLVYVLFYFLTPIIQSLALHQYFHRCFRVGMWLRSAVVTAVYRKALSTSLREGTTIGEIVNLMSVDAQKFMDLCPYLHMIWSALAQIAVSLTLLYLHLGPSIFAGLGIMLIMIPCNILISNLAKKRQSASMKLKDQRTKAVNEVLNGIKVIKLYSWEQSFMEHVKSIRDSELSVMKTIKYIQGFSLLLWSMSPMLVSVATFAVFILTGGTLTAEIAFPSLSLFNVMQFPINMLPNVVTSIIEASVSVQRLQRFLLKKDLDPNVIDREIKEEGVVIKIENASFEWETGKTTLHDINLKVKDKELVAIVGHVGSGKSSLVSSMVGDLDKTQGNIAVKGSLALVTQQAWIQNNTLKNNILFASDLDQEKYDRVVESCCLLPDIKILPGGDQTEIGEKGINLSGGQKQRVSIARAVYSDADIYIFDDPLSAVDAHVGRSIFQNVLSSNHGILSNKTRILVTHAVHYLPFVDRIIMMKDGRIAEVGTFSELLKNEDGPFAQLMSHAEKEKVSEEDDEGEAPVATPESEKLVETIDSPSTSSSVDGKEEEEETNGEIEQLIESNPEIRKSMEKIKLLDQPPLTDEQMEDILIDDNQNHLGQMKKQKESNRMSIPFIKEQLKMFKDTIPKSFNMKNIGEMKPQPTSPTIVKDNTKIISTETKQEGKVSLKLYFLYFIAIGPTLATSIIFFYVATQVLSILANWWLSVWSDSYNETDSGEPQNDRSKYYLSVYVAFSFSAISTTFLRSFSMVFGSIKGSKLFHEKMFQSVIRSPMSFFDTTPIGRILNRFSKDQLTIDESIARTLGMFLNTFCQVFGSILVIALVSPFVILAMVPIAALFYFIQRYYLNSSRELTRLEGISRSPIYAHFSETLAGVTTIRAFSEKYRFVKENERLLDENQKCYYINISANRWLALRLEFLGACIVTSTVLYTVLASHHIDPGTAGLVITYALAITSNMNWMVRMSCDLENAVVSIERIQEYCVLPSEAALTNDFSVPRTWPDQGGITFKNLWLAYREGLDPVLRGVSCQIQSKQKVGIVGRTGAGKSSLTQALFRLVEPMRGTIEIDGVDICKLGLHTLRSRISIIPQDPVLFAGTVRSNLDPFNQYTDDQIWESLERSHLKRAIKDLSGGIDSPVAENGDNFSIGQRQLMCMSRALLKKAKIIVLDEATAAIDVETDALIQNTIRSEFSDCTVLTIAHRINTIKDCDMVMVMDKGQLVEFDSPATLVSNPQSIYYSLVKKSEVDH
eukprot:gene9679-11876_t